MTSSSIIDFYFKYDSWIYLLLGVSLSAINLGLATVAIVVNIIYVLFKIQVQRKILKNHEKEERQGVDDTRRP